MRILIVDDDRFLGDFVAKELSKHGHETTYLQSAVKALAAANEADFDMMLCDLVMPGLNGIHAIRAIRKRCPNLPIIVLSSLDPTRWEARSKEVGATCYLHKPVTVEHLLDEVEMVNRSRVSLTIGIIDFDPEHRTRLTTDLLKRGCKVKAWSTLAEMLAEAAAEKPLSLLLIDTATPDAITALGWAKEYRVPAVAFGRRDSYEEENMLRLGASLCVDKPVDGQNLLTQARFLTA